MVAGNGSAMVYARPDAPRERRWPLGRLRQPDTFGTRQDLIARLLREPAVALVAAEEEDRSIVVAGLQGEATVSRADGRIRYEPRSGDPLEVGGGFTGSPREWLARSWHAAMPDAAYQLLDQFRAERTGDLVVIANEGYDFRERFEIPEHRSGHGSLIRAHMHVPLWSNRALGTVPLRTVDLFPTMLDWIGVDVPEEIDGELVWRAMAAADNPPSGR
jgi:hypothetical protein